MCVRSAASSSFDPLDCSSSVHGIFQARLLEQVAVFYSRESSGPRNQTRNSCIGRWILYPKTVLVGRSHIICWDSIWWDWLEQEIGLCWRKPYFMISPRQSRPAWVCHHLELKKIKNLKRREREWETNSSNPNRAETQIATFNYIIYFWWIYFWQFYRLTRECILDAKKPIIHSGLFEHKNCQMILIQF